MRRRAKHHDIPGQEAPPVFGTWKRFYAAVIVWLVLLIVFFYLFTHHFS